MSRQASTGGAGVETAGDGVAAGRLEAQPSARRTIDSVERGRLMGVPPGAAGAEGSTSSTRTRSAGSRLRAASSTWAAVTARYRAMSFGRNPGSPVQKA